jgi:hypothetical protein
MTDITKIPKEDQDDDFEFGNSGSGKGEEGKTPEELAAEAAAAEEAAKGGGGGQGKSPEELAAEAAELEKSIEEAANTAVEEAKKENKTEEEIEQIRIDAIRKVKYEGKSEEEIIAIETDEYIKVIGEDAENKAKEEGKSEEEIKIAKAEAEKNARLELESDDDLFIEKTEKKDDGKTTGNDFDIKSLAESFEVEAEDIDEFKEKINEKIEGAKQEIKLDDYTPDAKALIKHLNENGGKIEDFINNKEISELQSVIAMKPEEKVFRVRFGELVDSGLKEKEAKEKVTEELEDYSTREIKDASDKIDQQAKDLISNNVKKIIGDREKTASENAKKVEARVTKERKSQIKYINSVENFMGIPLTDKAKKNIVRDVESGAFDEIANKTPEASKFRAYMLEKFGSKIQDTSTKKMKEQNRKGHNAAVDKMTSTLYNIKRGKSSSGHQKQGDGVKSFDNWSDSKLFGDED